MGTGCCVPSDLWLSTGEFLGSHGRRFVPLVVGLVVMGTVLGLERSLLPLMASSVWGQDSYKAKTMFIVSFGLAKSGMNLVTGQLADRVGRKRMLALGFLIGLPVPLVVIFTDSWDVVVAVNVLFGMSQGMIGSSLIFMMIDVFGMHRKGMAVGLSEAIIYGSVSIMSAVASEIADKHGYRPVPFILGAIVGALGLVSSAFVIDTMDLVADQQQLASAETAESASLVTMESGVVEDVVAQDAPPDAGLSDALAGASLGSATAGEAMFKLAKNPNFLIIALCGLIDKTKDSCIWGLAPEFLESTHGVSVGMTGIILAFYTAFWGGSQLFFGGFTDRFGRKTFLIGGLIVNTVALAGFVLAPEIIPHYSERVIVWIVCTILLGLGTGAIYPTMQAAAADEVEPAWRASSLGIYRAVRDFGYALGAVSSSSIADTFGISWSFGGLAILIAVLAVLMTIVYRNKKRLGTFPTT